MVGGLGTWALAGPWQNGLGPSDDGEAIAAIHRALDLGVDWIDTAPAYGLGHAEEIVGRAIRGRRDRVFVSTKCGMIWDEGKRVRIHAGAKSVRAEIDDTLARLGTDHVDLYQVHWPDPSTPVEESWSEMARLKEEEQGPVHRCQQLRCRPPRAVRARSLTWRRSSPSTTCSSATWSAKILPWCRAHGAGVVAYSPMQSGLLTGAFDPGKLAPDDARRRSAAFTGARLAAAEALRS